MFTENELNQMMNGESIVDTVAEQPVAQEPASMPPEAAENAQEPAGEAIPAPVEDAGEATESDSVPQTSENAESVLKITKENAVSVSDIILNNSDKYVKMIVMNSNVHGISAECDVSNYIVYIDTTKNIPCVYDCQRLYVPKSSVKNDDGTWKVTSIEGRRSGVIIHCGTERELVMSKNFIYDCQLDANGSIQSIQEYDRKSIIKNVTVQPVSDYDVAVIYVQKVLPKIVKCGKYTTIEALREQVKLAYNSVYDINAMFKIADLRLQLGC